MPSSAPRPLLRRAGWLSVLLTGATLFVSGIAGVSSVQGTLQAAKAEQRQALQVQDRSDGGWDCDRDRDRDGTSVRSLAAEM